MADKPGKIIHPDNELMKRVAKGDDEAFRLLFERHHRLAYSVIYRQLGVQSAAEDLVQEAFLRVYRGLDGFNGAASFFTWLYRIVKNLSIDLMRRPAWQRERVEPDLDDPDDLLHGTVRGADPSDLLHRSELSARIGAAFDALPSYHRDVIVMREV
jgi:RNA polymerase sigma-70 factor (ECF subfamily)